MASAESPPSVSALRAALGSQYRAGLAMLREAVELCPDQVWLEREGQTAPWQIAYHGLYFTHLYLQTDLDVFRPWEGHQGGVQHEDGFSGPVRPDIDTSLPELPEPYSKAQVLEYCTFCENIVDECIEAMDLASPESGFFWYPVSKLEHQIVNIRHLSHHAGQLIDRVRRNADRGTRWIASRHP